MFDVGNPNKSGDRISCSVAHDSKPPLNDRRLLQDARALSRWSGSLSAMLIDLRRYFSGDLDRLIIFLVFATGELARRANGGEAKGINALSVADITLIPRETTRRKLRELGAQGLLCCAADGLWYLGEQASMDLITASFTMLLEDSVRQRLRSASFAA